MQAPAPHAFLPSPAPAFRRPEFFGFVQALGNKADVQAPEPERRPRAVDKLDRASHVGSGRVPLLTCSARQIHMRSGLPSNASKAAQFLCLRDIAIISMQRTCSCAQSAVGICQCSVVPRLYGSLATCLRSHPSWNGPRARDHSHLLRASKPLREHGCVRMLIPPSPPAPWNCVNQSQRLLGVPHAASFLERAQSIADSITPNDVPAVDHAVCQARADALQYPEPPHFLSLVGFGGGGGEGLATRAHK